MYETDIIWVDISEKKRDIDMWHPVNTWTFNNAICEADSPQKVTIRGNKLQRDLQGLRTGYLYRSVSDYL